MATTPKTKIDWEPYRGTNGTLDYMLKKGIEPTRENYIFMDYGGKPPEPWTAEHESMLPEPLQEGYKDD
jgi:hypothetical protein